jgi:SAM-dependent methyltransferase
MSPPPSTSAFQALQDAHFEAADEAHFHWTTTDPAFAPVEDALLTPWLGTLPFPCLEVGCGEGTNLARLAPRGAPFAVDRSPRRAAFATRAVPGARVAAADALHLPFRNGAFRGVLVRDLLHHLDVPAAALAEVARVLAPGGTLVLLEPNARNPFLQLMAALIPAERGLRRFSPTYVRGLLGGQPFTDVRIEAAAGVPLRRLVLHYRFGIPALGRIRATARALAAVERTGERLLPRTRWSYVVARARRV